MYNFISSSPVLTNVSISGNSAGNDGGGMYNDSYSSPVLINLTLSGNSAGNDGGGMYNFISSSPVLINVSISGNSAGSYGGGMCNGILSSSPDIRNSLVWGNTAPTGPAVYDHSSSTSVFTYSIVEGSGGSGSGSWANFGADNGGNKDEDPKFNTPATAPAPTTTGEYWLQALSPAIDVGNNSLYPTDADAVNALRPPYSPTLSEAAKAAINAVLTPAPGKDLDGNTRIQGTKIDMGAYEAQ
jgi:hypothetical protein